MTEHAVGTPALEHLPIVFVHGVGDSGSAWDDIILELKARGMEREFVTYDLRGHGTSDNPELVEDVWDFVDDLIQLVDERGIDRFDLVGFSLGGLVVQAAAIKHPDRIGNLVVIGSVAGRTPEESERALTRLQDIREHGPVGVAERSIDRWYPAEFLEEHPEVRDKVLARMRALNPERYAAAYKVLATTDLADQLHLITAPTLAIAAEGDVGSPPHMSQLIAERTGGRVVVLPGIKHGGIMHECAATTAEEIAAHVG